MSDKSGISISPMARKMAAKRGIDLATLKGSGPNGTIVRADIENVGESAAEPAKAGAKSEAKTSAASSDEPRTDIPHEQIKSTSMRKVIAQRLTESKQQVPHIYLTVDVRLDELLKLRSELNERLAKDGIKLSVNDLLIKALGAALTEVPSCNVSFSGDKLLKYNRADISVAVSIPNGLITPIVTDVGRKSISAISKEMEALSEKAKEGKLQPHEFQGGTASLSNMGMMGITHFDAVINPPQGMIMTIGAGEKRPAILRGEIAIATLMSATGSFDHRAIDGADAAALMAAFKRYVEQPFALIA